MNEIMIPYMGWLLDQIVSKLKEKNVETTQIINRNNIHYLIALLYVIINKTFLDESYTLVVLKQLFNFDVSVLSSDELTLLFLLDFKIIPSLNDILSYKKVLCK
jgi:hypothetical protein